MGPPRGSNRDATKAPGTKGKSKKLTEAQKQNIELKKQQGPVDDNKLGKKAQKRKAESQAPNIKGQENWKQMSVTSLADLEKNLDLAILATLARKLANKKDFQEHLNVLRKRFLEHCSTLNVPFYKQKLEGAAHRLLEETKKSEAEKQTLNSLEENLRAVVSALEKNEQETNALEHQCSVWRNTLQDQEEEFEQRKEAVVKLPLLWPAKDEITLEAKMRKAVPGSEAETMARKLGEILKNSESLQDAQELLSLAHRHVDELFNLLPEVQTGPGPPPT
uniref:Centromere protein Q n=1 Tax=Neogobius melanostomus TaxID=47308 RepID=A0A8C6TRE9_9GOBI